jgi:sugar O-acyltransferase (sialic acid O-acetyltransferase NeuD family)
MLVIGAKGFAKQLLEIIIQNKLDENLCFFDDVNEDTPDLLYNRFPVLRSIVEAKNYLERIDSRFLIGIGNPVNRSSLCDKFEKIGGIPSTIISNSAQIATLDVKVGIGTTILANSILEIGVSIGKGCLINLNVLITHDCRIGDFSEISPGAIVLGECSIKEQVFIGAGAIIMPKLTVGKNAIIGAGSVITKDVPDNSIVFGVPGKIKPE